MNKKKLIAILTLMCFMFTLVPVAAMAETSIALTGNCGKTLMDGEDFSDNVTWKLELTGEKVIVSSVEKDAYKLTISGTGEMADFVWNSSESSINAGWGKYRSQITEVVVEDGITYIGGFSFRSFTNLSKVTLANTVTEIGDHAFYWAAKNGSFTVTFPSKLQKVGECAFTSSGLTGNVFLPSTVTEIGNQAFEAPKITGLKVSSSGLRIGDYGVKAYSIKSIDLSSVVNLTIGELVTQTAKDAVVYVQTEEIRNDVYDKNSGTASTFPSTHVKAFVVTNGGTFEGMPSALYIKPIKGEYTLSGWYTNAELTVEASYTEVDGEKVYSVTEKNTYYAKWVSEITFDANEGTLISDDSITVDEGDAIGELPTDPTRDGYTFKGWYTAETDGTKLEATTVPTGNATYYAQWEGNPFTIRFDSNGGTSATTMSAVMYYGETEALPANPFTNPGFNFAGWALSLDGEMKYADNAEVTIDTPVANNELTLYAVWTKKDVLNPTVNKQSYVYDGAAQAYVLADYTVSYEQSGQAVTPINVGVYDVVVSKEETSSTAAYANTFSGALEITKATPTITLTASEATVKGAKTITLTADVTGLIGSDTGVITLDAPTGLTVTDKGNGVYEVALPNATADYTFTAKLDAGANYNEVSDDVTVSATRKSSSTSNDSGTTTSKPQATVTTPNSDVTVTEKAVSNTVINKAEREVASNKDVQVIGGTSSAVNITAKENGSTMTNFAEPLTVTVPVSKAAMKDVDDVSKLTLAKVVTNKDGSADLIYVGGNYDTQKGTFTALVDEPGDYILVENANIQKIELQIGNAEYAVNGNETTNDTAPMNYNNRTLVAIRYIAEIFGAEVGWDPQTYTVTIEIDGKVLTMVINEQIPGFDTPAILHNNRTMVPLRYISEAVGAKVIYVPSTQGIIVVK